MTLIHRRSFLSGAVALVFSGALRGLSPLEVLAQEEEDEEKPAVNHDHSDKFYESTYTKENLSELESELKKHPTSKGYVRLSDLFYETNNLDACEKAARDAIKTDPQNPDGYSNLGAVYHSKKRLDEAISLTKKAIKIDPSDPVYYYNVGRYLTDQQKYEEALNYTERSLKLNPTFNVAIKQKKYLLKKIGR